MKYIAHVPTEQYGYIEVEIEGTPENAVAEYLALRDEWMKPRNGVGLAAKEWREALDRYLKEGTMEADTYASMSKPQQEVIQEIKKHFKRNDNSPNKHVNIS